MIKIAFPFFTGLPAVKKPHPANEWGPVNSMQLFRFRQKQTLRKVLHGVSVRVRPEDIRRSS